MRHSYPECPTGTILSPATNNILLRLEHLQLYFNTFFSTVHQNSNKPKSRDLLYGPAFLPSHETNINVFFDID